MELRLPHRLASPADGEAQTVAAAENTIWNTICFFINMPGHVCFTQSL